MINYYYCSNRFHCFSKFTIIVLILLSTRTATTTNTSWMLPVVSGFSVVPVSRRVAISSSVPNHHPTIVVPRRSFLLLLATIAPKDTTTTSSSSSSSEQSSSSSSASEELKIQVLQTIQNVYKEAQSYSEQINFSDPVAASVFYAVFAAIRRTPVPLGLYGIPFIIRSYELQQAIRSSKNDTKTDTTNFKNYFTMEHLYQALQDDFLDAARGSTDNRKGWKITDVSQPRGNSFEEARMTYDDVQRALEKGTVIFNAAGAHIPKLAEPSLACTDATALPCALNLYITADGKRTSAPPHTDKQDVLVVQTSGRKNWKVFSVPDAALKPEADIFARGKMEDNLSLYTLENDPNVELLIETTLNPGDVLFCPAGFPHTTSTVSTDDNPPTDINNNNDEREDRTSMHLTLGIDHHIWELDYISARRLALRSAGVADTALGGVDDPDRYTGKVNELPSDLRAAVFAELPLGLLDDDEEISKSYVELATDKLQQISAAIDTESANQVDPSIWKETIERLQQQGKELLEIHRDMYFAAIDEGATRAVEDAMTAHLSESQQPQKVMSPERIQRLSLFRVKLYYDRIDQSKQQLKEWSYAGTKKTSHDGDSIGLPDNWAYTLPVSVGDQVNANLGGAMFAATVARITPAGTYDVTFFDGDKEFGLPRDMIQLLNPPKFSSEGGSDTVDTAKMTPKQLKRWKKEQEKLTKK